MYLFQKALAIFLAPFRVALGKLNIRAKNAAVGACCVMLMLFFIAFFSASTWEYLLHPLTLDHMICCIILFVLVIFSIRGKLQPVDWNPFLFWGMEITGASMAAISFLHPIGSGYRVFALMLMFVFPCIYYVWNNRGDYNTLFEYISVATAVTGLIYFVYCFYLVYHGVPLCMTYRVRAGMYNANLFSMVGMVMVTSAVYMLFLRRKSIWWFILCAVSIGAGLTIVALGSSRTSMIVMAGTLVCFVIYRIKIRKELDGKKGFLVFVAKLLAVALSAVLFMMIGTWMITTHTALARQQLIEAGETVSEESNDKPDVTDSAVNRFDVSGQDMDSFSSGRMHIWKGYAQFLNLLGNDFSKADWEALTQNHEKHAHNNFLEFAFRFGIPVALMHLILEAYAGIIALKYLFSRKYKDPAYFFSAMYLMMYAVESLIEIATLPFERHAPFFFYMALIPMFVREKREEKE